MEVWSDQSPALPLYSSSAQSRVLKAKIWFADVYVSTRLASNMSYPVQALPVW